MDLTSSGFHDSAQSNKYPRPLNQALARNGSEERLRLGSLSKNDVPSNKREKEDPVIVKPPSSTVETLDCEGTQLIQRCVIIQRDEKGYGLTVSGDNPVFVQSVKDDGAASRAGVQRGDRIIKVNGTLVTQSNHVEVVHLIKSGSYVALTLLSRPSGHRSHGSGCAPNSSPPGHHPSGQLQHHHSHSHHHSYQNQHGNMNAANRSSITGPHPVDGAMQQQLNAARVRTMQQMLEQEREYVEKQKSEYAKNPSEKIKSELNTANQRVRQIEETLSLALSQSNYFWMPKSPQNSRSYTQEPPPPPPPPRRHTSSIPHQTSLPTTLPPVPPVRVESKQQSCDSNQDSNSPASTNQYPLSHSMDNIQKINAWASSGPTHSRQRSSPDAILHLNENLRHHQSPDLSRSHSDVVTSSRKLNSSDSGSEVNMKRSKTCDNSSTSRASSFGAYDSTSTDSPRVTPPGTPPPPYSNFERIENAEAMEGGDATTSDESPISPMGKSPCAGDISDDMKMECSDNQINVSELSSPLEGTPPSGKNHAVHGLPFIHHHPIISMEEEDPPSDNENSHAHMNDHGPFKKWAKLCKHPCHLSVFIRYLISNSDPSSAFFFLISMMYEEGNIKEMKKWAYEIHSSFLMPGAPLKVNNIDENILRGIDDVLQTHLDREDKLKKIFAPARKKAVHEISELLADFRNKRQMGLGNLYGASDAQLHDSIHDASKATKIVESVLVNLLESSFTEEIVAAKDKDSAIASAVATLLNKFFLLKSQYATAVSERYPQFLSKDSKSKGIKFLKGSKKAVLIQGHHFNPQHYFIVTYCNHCQLIIWGIGNQGYQCQYCDMNVHKPCVRIVEETCIGARSANKKDKKKDRVAGLVENFIGKSRKPSPNNPSPSDRVRRFPDDMTDFSAPILGIAEFQQDSTSGEKGVPAGRVDKLRKTFEVVNENDDRGVNSNGQTTVLSNSGASSGLPDGTTPSEGSKKGTSVVRSESLRTRREAKHSFRKRSDPNIPRSNSDVDGDDRAITALNQSGSSSNSSLSTKSLDSPSNSLEAVHKPTSNEISPLTSNAPSAIVHSPSTCSGQRRDENDDSDFDVDPNPPNWADSVNWEIVKHLKPKEKKRQDVINELIHTERTHVRNLKVLEKVFYRPMQSGEILPPDQIKLLFANLEEMIQIHNKLNMKLKAKRKEDPIVGDIGEILLEMFDGAPGEVFRVAAATFCENQSIALESLKVRQRKDQKLAQFLTECSSNPLCRRFQLKDIIPTGMQRLTKYPLLLENLAKYTCPTTAEYANLMKALDCSKDILNYVNQAVKDAENNHRLEQFQKKIDRGPFEKFDHPISAEYKNLDLTKCRMLHEGSLQWRLKQKLVDLHVLLLEDIVVLLQKQDEKYVLKYHNTNVGSGRDETKLTHSPIIKVANLLSRNVATDKKAFFLVSTSDKIGPQIYELIALSSADRKTWLRHITEAAESYKAKETKNKRIEHIPNAPEQRESTEDSAEDNFKRNSLENQESRDTAEGGDISDVGETPEISERPELTVLTSPDSKPSAECRISTGTASEGEDGDDSAASAASASATSQGTPTPLPGIGTSPSIPRRFQKVEILKIVEGPPLIEPTEVVITEGAVLQTAEPVLAPIEKLRRKDQLIKDALNEKHDLVADILHIPREEIGHQSDFTCSVEEDKDAKELVLAAMAHVTRLAEVLNDSLTVTEEDAINAGSEAPSTDLAIPTFGSPSGSTSPRVPSPKPGRKACRMPSAPVHVLLNISSALSVHMSQLLALVTEREEERERLRREVRASREQIHKLHDARRRTPQSQSPSHSRPNSFISMSSSTSEPCDIIERLHGEDDLAIPSTLEAYNKLVNQPTFTLGAFSNVSDDHPTDVSGEDLTLELFVDAPTESCTDVAESPGASDEEEDEDDDDAKAQCGETVASPDSSAQAVPIQVAPEEQTGTCGDCSKDSNPQTKLDGTGSSECGAVF